MKNRDFINKIICDDTMIVLQKLEDKSIDVVITDPPYFLDKMDNKWDNKKVANKNNQGIIKSLPSGMKFNKEDGEKFYNWYYDISKEIFRILKPGGYFFSFSSPRLYHRMASAIDDVGFEIRDTFIWLYTQNQVKAMGLNHFIEKLQIEKGEKDKLKVKFNGWKTPQIKSCFEPIVMAQKSVEGTYLNNMIKYEVGLLNTKVRIGDNMYPANVFIDDRMNEYIDKIFLLPKPSKKEKGEYNFHKTVKPLSIFEYLINISTFSENSIILDPFVGSGTALVAAKKLKRNFIGIDLNELYIEIAKKRLSEIEVKSR